MKSTMGMGLLVAVIVSWSACSSEPEDEGTGGGDAGGAGGGGCEDPLVVCDEECVDLNSSTDHCGACDSTCPEEPNVSVMCVNLGGIGPACDYTCDPGFVKDMMGQCIVQ